MTKKDDNSKLKELLGIDGKSLKEISKDAEKNEKLKKTKKGTNKKTKTDFPGYRGESLVMNPRDFSDLIMDSDDLLDSSDLKDHSNTGILTKIVRDLKDPQNYKSLKEIIKDNYGGNKQIKQKKSKKQKLREILEKDEFFQKILHSCIEKWEIKEKRDYKILGKSIHYCCNKENKLIKFKLIRFRKINNLKKGIIEKDLGTYIKYYCIDCGGIYCSSQHSPSSIARDRKKRIRLQNSVLNQM